MWMMITTINGIIVFFLVIVIIFLSDVISIINMSVSILWGITYIIYMTIHACYQRYKLVNLDFNDEIIIYRYKTYDFIILFVDICALGLLIYVVDIINYLNVIPYATIITSSVFLILRICQFLINMIATCAFPSLFCDEVQENPISDLLLYLKQNTTEIRSDSNCSICLVDLQNDTNLIQLTCEHYFHEECITEWLSMNDIPNCPLCRTEQVIDV